MSGMTRLAGACPPDGRERNTLGSRLSVFDGDNVRLNLAVYCPSPEPLGDGFRRDVGCFVEPRGVTRLDLIP